ncbi:MAG: ParB/RepB/Spo0J family partition protein [Verrucomicrobia bacterium]|nr:ParB/RepB/Spo0J family partition protein [Verrucomicrobiota bacterium]
MTHKKALGKGLDALIQRGLSKTATAPTAAPVPVPPLAAPAPSVIAAPVTVAAPPVAPSAPPAPLAPPAPSADAVAQVEIGRIRANPFQPRTKFEHEALEELVASIREHGIVSPLIVRRAADGQGYELIAGERRLRAAREAGLATVPIIVRDADDRDSLELALIENLQRQDLNPIEESHGYQQLIDKFGLTQEQVAQQVGKNRATVANALRMLGLPEQVQAWVRDGQLSVGHAKVILGLTITDEMTIVAERVLRDGLNVRDTERLVERIKATTGRRQPIRRKRGADAEKPPHVLAIENGICRKLGTKVTIHPQTIGGFIRVEYYNDDDLSRLGGILGGEL